jgi:hypothetical protein
MFDHIQLKVKDNLSKRFYTAALAPLGFNWSTRATD